MIYTWTQKKVEIFLLNDGGNLATTNQSNDATANNQSACCNVVYTTN